ncbi:MAG: heavy metal-associated domain-containing protein [Flavobacteriaceae bacterium]
MKNFTILSAFTIISFVLISCKNEVKTEITDVSEVEVTKTITSTSQNKAITKAEFTIEGMTCAMGCAKRIEHMLEEMDGVTTAKVDFEKKLAMVTYEEGKVTTTSLEETVKSAGDVYSITEMKTVESFTSSEAKDKVAHECSKECPKEGCTAERKEACKKDCKKTGCAKKA